MTGSRKKYGVIVGFPYYGRYLADLINERSETWRLEYRGESYAARLRSLLEMKRCDAVISFGGPAPDQAIADAARHYNVPVIVIWAGSDVSAAGKDPGTLEIVKDEGHVNIADGEWLVDELREFGIEASYDPVTAIEAAAKIAPLPREFRVVTYLPEPRRAFYGEKSVYAVARACPDVSFSVVGAGHANPAAPPNVRFLGYVDNMAHVLDTSTVLLRLPEHDGKSMLVLEALARGRHVIWTYDFPGVHHATSLTAAIQMMQALRDDHRRGTLGVNRAGHQFVQEHFSRGTIAANFEAVLDRAVHEKLPRISTSRQTVVISGFTLFGAMVARAARWATPNWEPRVFRGGSRLARLSSAVQLMRADAWYCIGSPIPDRWLHLVAQLTGKRRVIHWVGSDIELLKSQPAIRRLCAKDTVRHLAEADWMVDELAAYGVRASVAPLPPQVRIPDYIPPLPDRFTLLLYVPRSRADFYGRREYERLFRRFSGRPIKFIVVGGGSVFVPPGADVEIAGWKSDLCDVYERTSALLRFTRHDGLSLMALEALAYGRHLIWSRNFPFGACARTYDDCEHAVEDLLERHERGELRPQFQAAEYVRDTYDVRRCVERIATFWQPSSSGDMHPFSPVGARG
ncbi:MAG: glycosyltransferase [Candidatus Eremiobacteraeota bacterium]|nr:glycosyltransferase [Candidatus Eremiobacteraeota bacterium]